MVPGVCHPNEHMCKSERFGAFVDQYTIFTNRVLKEHMESGKHMTQEWFDDKTSYSIFRCMDGYEETSQVLMPDEAFGTVSWRLLLLSTLAISLFAAFVFRRRRGNTVFRRHGHVIIILQRIWDSCFFHYSHLLANPVDGWAPSSMLWMWRMVHVGWLLGGSFLINKFYLCNMKGELATIKIEYIDTFEQLLTRNDIKHIQMWSEILLRNKEGFTTSQIEELTRKRRYDNSRHPRFDIAEVYIYRSGIILRKMSSSHQPCKNMYKGKKSYDPTRYSLGVSAGSPLWFREAVSSRLLRHVETEQKRPEEIKEQLKYKHQLAKDVSLVPPIVLSLHFAWPVFKSWLTGIALAIGAFVAEFTYHHLYLPPQ